MQLWSKLEINIYLFILIVAMIRYTFQLAVMISFTHVVLNLASLQLVFSRLHSNLDPEPHFDLVLILSYMYCGQKYQKQQKMHHLSTLLLLPLVLLCNTKLLDYTRMPYSGGFSSHTYFDAFLCCLYRYTPSLFSSNNDLLHLFNLDRNLRKPSLEFNRELSLKSDNERQI